MTERDKAPKTTADGHGDAPVARPGDADAALDAAFAAARAEASAKGAMPDAVAARLLADALAEQPRLAVPREAAPQAAPSWAFWDRLRLVFGGEGLGWPASTGLAACALAGVWLGYAPPMALEGVAAAVLGEVGLATQFGDAAAEELLLAYDLGGLDG